MSSQPEPAAGAEKQASEFTKPTRELVALVLLGANAVMLFFSVVDLLMPYDFDPGGFTGRASIGFSNFVGLVPVGLPVLAVLISTHIAPATARARLVTAVALIEYAVSALFGVICLFAAFVGTVESGTFSAVRAGFENFLRHLAQLCMLAAVGYLVFRLWQGMYATPKPAAAQPYGQPGVPTGYGQPGAPTGYGQPGAPAGYGQPGAPAGYGQPQAPSGYPAGGSGSGVPTQAYGQPWGGYAYPAQAAPAQSPSGYPPSGAPGAQAVQPLHAETSQFPFIPPASAAPGSPAGGGQPEQPSGDQPAGEQSGGDQRPFQL
ncbi:MAG: hypothetical protein FWJ93_01800 [Micromonosporaceae bacterium]